jgi:hypothetical protein
LESWANALWEARLRKKTKTSEKFIKAVIKLLSNFILISFEKY